MSLVAIFRLTLLIGAFIYGSAISSAAEIDERIKFILKERCTACHGPTGQGSNSLFPKLSGQNTDYLIRQMFAFKSGERKSTVMGPQLADLSGNDLAELAHYFSSQQLIPNATPDSELASFGQATYLQGNPETGLPACAVCHGPTGRGGRMLPRLAGQHSEYIEKQLRNFIEHSRTTDQTLMHSVASKMSSKEIHAVSYFLSGLN